MVVINDTPSQVVWAHEYGYNLGLIHNAGRVCWSDRAHQHAVPLSNDCQDVTYEDPFDLMGHGWWGWAGISSAQQEKLGVLPAGDRLALSSGGTVTLNSMSTGSACAASIWRWAAPCGTSNTTLQPGRRAVSTTRPTRDTTESNAPRLVPESGRHPTAHLISESRIGEGRTRGRAGGRRQRCEHRIGRSGLGVRC